MTGGHGFLGSRVVSLLKADGVEVFTDSRADLDIRNSFLLESRIIDVDPSVIFHCAGVVGGLADNRKRPMTYLVDNLMMGLNVLNISRVVEAKVVIAGSSCMYPDFMPEGGYKESDAWFGAPFFGNKSYGIAKRVVAEIASAYNSEEGSKHCTVVLPNMYGPGADSSEKGHFIPSVVEKVLKGVRFNKSSLKMFGDGVAMREFIHVDDAANALLFAYKSGVEGTINFGTGYEISVQDVVSLICSFVGYKGRIEWGAREDSGQMRKMMDSVEATKMGWNPSVAFEKGLKEVVEAAMK